MKIFNGLLVIGVCATLCSCATIFTGTSEDVTFASQPSGATIYVDGVEKGVTPATIKLSKSADNFVTLKKAGYRDENLSVERRFEGWVLGNIVFGGIIGGIVDAVSGAWNAITPTQYTANLTKD